MNRFVNLTLTTINSCCN